MKPKDPVWSNFVVFENENSKEQKAKCLNCNAIISARAPRLKSHVQKCGKFESCGPNTPQKRNLSEMMTDSTKSSKDIISTETDRHVLAHLETLNRSLHTSRPQENPIINQQPDIANDISLLQQSYSTEETSSSKNTCKEKTSNGITAGRKAGDGKTHADGLVIKREPFTDDVDDEGPANKRVRFTLDNGPSTSAQDNSPLTEMSPVTSDTINLLSHGIESRETADNSVLPCICDATNKRKITQDAVNQMQYEVLVEQKKKLIAQTKYYNLMNEDVLKKREKLNAELAYYKDMHEKLRKDLHPGFSDTSNYEVL